MTNETSSEKKLDGCISGALLIGGTSIGAGILALPVVTGLSGFLPSMLVNTVCWLFMMTTGLLLLEVTLLMEEGANILSITRRFLGRIGQFIGGSLFIFLYYCLLISYIAGGAPQLMKIIYNQLGLEFSPFWGYVLFSTLFGTIIYFGHKVVDRVNWLLMFSLILSYILLLYFGSDDISAEFLLRKNWGLSVLSFPVFFSAYGYHNIIPSITFYLKKNVKSLRWAIILGTSLPFIFYSLWQWLILGTVSENELTNAAIQGMPITWTLQEITGSKMVRFTALFFGFFALVTSFLGVSLSMVDFFADGFNAKKGNFKKFLLCLLVFLPPAFFASLYPNIFVEALGVAGGFGEATLNGLFPVLMVWVCRYKMKLKSEKMVPGGRIFLSLLIIFTLIIIAFECYHLLS